MTSRTTEAFRKMFALLPAQTQEQARSAYRLFRDNPQHSSLRYRRVHSTLPIYSARVGSHYRAVGIRDGEEITWFWISPHADYDHLLARL